MSNVIHANFAAFPSVSKPKCLQCAGVGNFCNWKMNGTPSVVDRHRFDADPDPNFDFDADPDPVSDWHHNDADPHADSTPIRRKTRQKYIHPQQCQFTMFIFIISGKGVMLLSIFWTAYLNFLVKSHKYMCLELLPIRICRIRRNAEDPTRSGSGFTTLGIPILYSEQDSETVKPRFRWTIFFRVSGN